MVAPFPYQSITFPGRTSIYPHEAAAVIRVTRQHILNLIHRGLLDAKQIGPSKSDYRIAVTAWEKFLSSRWQREGDFIGGSQASWERNVEKLRAALPPKEAKTVGTICLSRKALDLIGESLFPGKKTEFHSLLKEFGIVMGQCP